MHRKRVTWKVFPVSHDRRRQHVSLRNYSFCSLSQKSRQSRICDISSIYGHLRRKIPEWHLQWNNIHGFVADAKTNLRRVSPGVPGWFTVGGWRSSDPSTKLGWWFAGFTGGRLHNWRICEVSVFSKAKCMPFKLLKVYWEVVSNMFYFPPTWGNNPIWLIFIYFSNGLKPPTRLKKTSFLLWICTSGGPTEWWNRRVAERMPCQCLILS